MDLIQNLDEYFPPMIQKQPIFFFGLIFQHQDGQVESNKYNLDMAQVLDSVSYASEKIWLNMNTVCVLILYTPV